MLAPQHLIHRALISVAEKTGIVPLAAALVARGVVLISTGGSARVLMAAGLPVTEVAAVTGFPEMLHGRVKTLHPAIHAGVLARRDCPEDLAALTERSIAPIDLVVCNLYPFAETVASGAGAAECLENVDVGGVALIRAAAKNHEAVTVVASAKKASASLLQRRLKVGYARAARLLDLMEENDLIGPGDGAKPREVYDEKVEDYMERS